MGRKGEAGTVYGSVAGAAEDDLDDLLVQTAGFKAMIARCRASLQTGGTVSAEDRLQELQDKLAAQGDTLPPSLLAQSKPQDKPEA